MASETYQGQFEKWQPNGCVYDYIDDIDKICDTSFFKLESMLQMASSDVNFPLTKMTRGSYEI